MSKFTAVNGDMQSDDDVASRPARDVVYVISTTATLWIAGDDRLRQTLAVARRHFNPDQHSATNAGNRSRTICSGGFRGGPSRVRPLAPFGRRTVAVTHGHVS